MNIWQSIGASLMAWGIALPTCFIPKWDGVLIIGMFIFFIGDSIFIAGSETGYTIKKVA